jgi:hypothetical protein
LTERFLVSLIPWVASIISRRVQATARELFLETKHPSIRF